MFPNVIWCHLSIGPQDKFAPGMMTVPKLMETMFNTKHILHCIQILTDVDDPCDPNPCQNGGTCCVIDFTAICNCAAEWPDCYSKLIW